MRKIYYVLRISPRCTKPYLFKKHNKTIITVPLSMERAALEVMNNAASGGVHTRLIAKIKHYYSIANPS